MAKPLSEINSEFESTRNNTESVSFNVPQNEWNEQWKPDTQKYTLPQPDPVTQRYTLPQPGPVTQRYTLPQPDQITPNYPLPQSEPAVSKYTLPQPEPVTPRYTLPQPDPYAPKYIQPQPDPYTPKYTQPQPDPYAPKYTQPQPDPYTPKYTQPQPDPYAPKYTQPQPDPRYLAGQVPPAYMPPSENAYYERERMPQTRAASNSSEYFAPAQKTEMPVYNYTNAAPDQWTDKPYIQERPRGSRQTENAAGDRPFNIDYTSTLRKTVTNSQDPKAKKRQDQAAVSPSLTKALQADSKGRSNSKGKAKSKRGEPQKRSLKNTIADVLFYGVLLVMLISVISWVRTNSKPVWIFGYTFMDVLTSSMQNTIPQGSLIVVQKTDPKDLKVGDAITYWVDDTTTITHQIITVYPNYEDSQLIGFQTKGTNVQAPDPDIVYETNVLGRVVNHVPKLGEMISFIPNLIMNPKYLLQVGVVFVSVIVLSFSLRGLFSSMKEDKAAKNKHKKKKRKGVANRGVYHT